MSLNALKLAAFLIFSSVVPTGKFCKFIQIICISFGYSNDWQMNLQDMDFAVIDIETSGLDSNNDQILEIGIIHFKKDKVIEYFHSIIRPEIFKNPAFHINGITEEMTIHAPSLSEISPTLQHLFKDKIFVIQHAEFDLSFLLNNPRTGNLFQDDSAVFCTLQLSRKFFPETKSHSLASLRKFFQIEPFQKSRTNNSHEALDDCFATMNVFRKCANKGNLWEQETEMTFYHQKNLKTIKDYRKKLTELLAEPA